MKCPKCGNEREGLIINTSRRAWYMMGFKPRYFKTYWCHICSKYFEIEVEKEEYED